jgi:phosphoribosylglycinamide formyltransferase-1
VIGVLVSGEGSNLQALLDNGLPVVAVASSNPTAWALTRAQQASVPTASFALPDFASRDARDVAMADWLQERDVRIVACAGFMELLTPTFLSRFPGRIVNIHPSLLPAFPGAHAIEDALAAGATETGVSVHWVDEGVDTGPVIAQERVGIVTGDSTATLRERLHDVEHRLYPEVLRELIE